MLKGLVLALLLFIAIYAMAFGAVMTLQPPLALAIPAVMAITATLALGAVLLLPDGGVVRLTVYGLRTPSAPWLAAGCLAGVIGGGAAAAMSLAFPSPSPIDLGALAPWMIFLFFCVLAPVQEELIFRGLLQSLLMRRAPVSGAGALFPVVAIATLFGLIHFDSGPATVAGAFGLGLIAGELRRRSGSIVPGIVAHALFNATSTLAN
ncbi:MAG: CPBP family intramembrane metalloprotease [Parvularculaceae bacterium]|nr:CPBP family intramembrane metalloprotease [Parvularculaceae bacterium]